MNPALALGGAAAVLWSLEQRHAVAVKPWMRPGYAQALSVLSAATIAGARYPVTDAIGWLVEVKRARIAALGQTEDGAKTYPRQSFGELLATIDAVVAAWRAARRVTDKPWGLIRGGDVGRPDEATGQWDEWIEQEIKRAGGIEYNWNRVMGPSFGALWMTSGAEMTKSFVGEDVIPILAWQIEIRQKVASEGAATVSEPYVQFVWHRLALACAAFDTYGNDPSGEFPEQPTIEGGIGAAVGAVGAAAAGAAGKVTGLIGDAVLSSWIPWAILLAVAWKVSK